MYVELDMTKKEDFDKYLRVMGGYTCKDNHITYVEKKVLGVIHSNKNAKFFYNQDGKIESVVALVDDYTDDDKILIWGNNSIGVKSLEELTQIIHTSFKFYKEYLINRNKHKFYVKIQWKDYQPKYMPQLHNIFVKLADEIGHLYFDFKINPEEQMEFTLKNA